MSKYKEMISDYYDKRLSLTEEDNKSAYEEYKKRKKNIEKEFFELTNLDLTDMKFLMFATFLQVSRWVLLGGKLGDKIDKSERLKDNDKSIKNQTKASQNEYKKSHPGKVKEGSGKYRTAMELAMTSKVPYDSTDKIPNPTFKVKANHRFKTLGHDPLLGYIFGTLNILTDTMTLIDFRSFNINMKGLVIESETNMVTILQNAFESIREDYLRLPAAIFAQSVHLKSDEFTKTGLPIPVITVFNEEFAGGLYNENYDNLCFMRDVKTVGKQAVFSILINTIIGLVHGLYYDKNKYPNRDVFEVKTRKILLYSNVLATTSNVLWSAIKKDTKSLDIGGFLVTAYILITDIKFIKRVQREFVQGKLEEKYNEEIAQLDESIDELLIRLKLNDF